MDCITGLQTARILANRDVRVIGVASNLRHFACRTRACDEVIYADTSRDDFTETLVKMGSRFSPKAVLFPCTDMTVLGISRHREALTESYHIALPSPDVVDLLMDKARFVEYATRRGLPIPNTRFLRTRADLENAISTLSFPLIVKPRLKTAEWESHFAKAYRVASAEALSALYERVQPWTDTVIVQEWITGRDSNLFSCNCYFDANSAPVVTFVARKIRQWPPEAGTSSLGEECQNDVVLDQTVQLFRDVRFHGLGYVEMKRDDRDGRYYIIEPNVGRPTGRSSIAEAGGVELLYTKYCDVAKLPLPNSTRQRYVGTKWIYLRHDFQSAATHWRRGELSLREWWRSWRGRKTEAVFSWRDPVPFWLDLWQATARFVRSRRQQT